jgi:phosphoribosyl 1,2-cyclic phosphodiesterase
MKVTCWGTRGSIATPGPETARYGGNTTCLEVILDDGSCLIFDAGTGIRKLGGELLSRGAPVDVSLFLTHAHWDHIQGFPFFTPAYIPGNQLQIYGYYQGEKHIEDILISQMESIHFPVNFNAMQADINFHNVTERSCDINGATISCADINHPGGGVGYRIEADGAVLVFIPDNDLTPSDDEEIFQRMVSFCKEADLLFHDSQFTPEQYDRFPTWGHSNYQRSVKLAMIADVPRLGLFHHDPGHDDNLIDAMVFQARHIVEQEGASVECFGARENQPLSL